MGRFKYLGRLLDRSYGNWPEALCNIRKASQIRKLLRREEADTTVLAKFYRAVVQAVLLFGAETWVLTETMIQRLEGAHVSFLRQVTRKQAMQRRDGFCLKVMEEAVLQGAGTHTLRTYVDRKQAIVAEWVASRPIFDVFFRDTVY